MSIKLWRVLFEQIYLSVTILFAVPEAVYGLMIINNETSDFSITLQIKWMVS